MDYEAFLIKKYNKTTLSKKEMAHELQVSERMKILSKIEGLKDYPTPNVKKLTNHSPQYRLRVGNYRVLFDIEDDKVTVYRVRDRKETY